MANNKKTFVLRLDDNAYKIIEKWATDEFRSVNGQLEWIINNAIKNANRDQKRLSGIKKNISQKK